MKGNITYSMSHIAYRELLKRCKGNKAALNDEICRGLNIPMTHAITYNVIDGQVASTSVRSKYIEILEDIAVYEVYDEHEDKAAQARDSRRS